MSSTNYYQRYLADNEDDLPDCCCGTLHLKTGIIILAFITTFISIIFIVGAGAILGNTDWYIWLGNALQIVGGIMGLCGPCCKSPMMVFYFFVWQIMGIFWWVLWIGLNVSNMTNQGYDTDMVYSTMQCAALVLWELYCIYEINRYYNKIRNPHSYWCLCFNQGQKCCCTYHCIKRWVAKATGDDIPDMEYSRDHGFDIEDVHKDNQQYNDQQTSTINSNKSSTKNNKKKTKINMKQDDHQYESYNDFKNHKRGYGRKNNKQKNVQQADDDFFH